MVNFTPGPSQLYFTVPDHVKKAFREGIPSISHRSKQFEAIYLATTQGLRTLLNIPQDYHIVFTGSATEIWERVIQNLVADQSFHFVNGAFSKRFFEVAQQLGKSPQKAEVPAGKGFEQPISTNSELVAITHNETSTGVSMALPVLHALRELNPDGVIVVDAVSSLPFPEFDYSKIDSVFFSVQKGFGLPAGLGVWIVNEKCVQRAEQLQIKGHRIGTYHSLPSLVSFARKNQTPETPNVLGIYLLGKVVNDFLARGVSAIRSETLYKAQLLYQALERSKSVRAFVEEKQSKSKTVIVADCGDQTNNLADRLQKIGLFPGEGYGEFRSSQLRFANFPAHSKEHFELLADLIESF